MTEAPSPTLAQRRDASLAMLARVSINWALAERDMARAGRLTAELRRLSAQASTPLEHSMNISAVAGDPAAPP